MGLWKRIKGSLGPEARTVIAVWLVTVGLLASLGLLVRVPAVVVLYGLGLAALPLGAGLVSLYLKGRRRQAALTAGEEAVLDGLYSPGELEALRSIFAQQADLRRRQQLAQRTLTDTFSMWAHQIKTPLAAAKLLAADQDPPSLPLRNALETIRAYVDMALTQVALSEKDPYLDLAPCRIDAVLEEVLQRTAGLFLAGQVQLAYTPTRLQVTSDSRLLAVLFEQVLTNAAKYSPAGQVTIFAEGSRVIIRDTGCGIAADELPRVFQRGYAGSRGRLDDRASGMGLYVARQIADYLDIGLDLTSRPQQGTTVILTFPVYSLRQE
ncbi:sensor histidine kinase [Peptococcus simiae]|uniref:sensor histidine kinase n=1 Tax=Peptococcus simiae TaxID=1643805 RepID=UPI00397EC1CD